MYSLPNRPEQHINEQKSIAILLYSLRNFGIVRSISSNDYGIDLEYEFVHNQQVTGRIIKIQLKAKKKVTQTKEGYITVNKIKQSTLNYWAELSYYTNVFVVLVDVDSENIYISQPIFWDAIKQIDNTNKLKSIKLKTYKESGVITPILVDSFTLIPNMMEIKLHNKMFLSHIKSFIEDYYFSSSCDFDTEVNDYYNLDTLFSISKILLWNKPLNDKIEKVNPEFEWFDKNAYYEKDYYVIKYKKIEKTIEYLLNELMSYSIHFRDKMMNTFMYWVCKDLNYYQFVLSYDIKKEMLTDYKIYDNFFPLRDHIVSDIIDKQIKNLTTAST